MRCFGRHRFDGLCLPSHGVDSRVQASAEYLVVLAKLDELDPRLRWIVHAIFYGHDMRWPDVVSVTSDLATAPDRPCSEGWCVCKEAGPCEKRHPHLATQ